MCTCWNLYVIPERFFRKQCSTCMKVSTGLLTLSEVQNPVNWNRKLGVLLQSCRCPSNHLVSGGPPSCRDSFPSPTL